MKIAVNATILDNKPSGLGVYAVKMVRAMCRAAGGDDIVIFTSYPAAFDGCGAEIRSVSEIVQPRHGKLAGIARFFWTQVVYPLRLRRERCDIVYNTTHHAVFHASAPQIMTVHDLLPIKFPSRYRPQYWYFKYVLPALINKCMAIITVSENSKKDIVGYYGIPADKIVVAYNSYDAYNFRRTVSQSVRNSSADGGYILAVGASYLNKNIEGLLEAYSRIKDRTTCKLLIAGGRSQYIKTLKNRAQALGLGDRVEFLDYVGNEKLRALYSNAAMLVFPSIYEGFGIPPLEAMACGCPVVASNASSIPEVCADAAFYVDPYNIESIADGIYKVLTDNDLRKFLVEKGFERIKVFSWDESARKVLDVIRCAGNKG